MYNYLLPYFLLMAHFISGALWLTRINRKLEADRVRQQWIKYGVYLVLVNLLWFCIIYCKTVFPFIGWIVILLASWEWWRAVRKLKGRVALVLAFLLISAGFAGFLYMDQNTLLFAFFVVVLFDGSCQVTGQLAGKRALLPKISPRKTIEGLAGGTVITLASTLLTRSSFSFEWGELILSTCLIMAAAFTGDMLASAVKRKAKIRTFGRAVPGHGGVIDRFDSLLMTGSLLHLLSLIRGWPG